MNKESLKVLWEKSLKILNTASKVAIVVVAIAAGFASGNLYSKYKTTIEVTEMQKAHDQKVTSVAINERGEIMIIDRKSGTYQLYTDTVGKMIFDLYASKMYYKTKTN
jgi:hypothetical protein